ncbi:YihY/virulence factor BrkB family protein [Streptomyces sp. HC44]|uniref:YihY/virulence factor BrkB family protein n=1 Tax=Streptomyces scabichelini TaxID=2711217 RepID=A0A6G4UZD5_9ACTN|nr:YhjD/YihY/BrkB family envelope integrity protein [Streptomyces scabichelini]NGO07109.1 YihY/virulence factor BrkB family protein [Streptomyces scabichelini]
MTRKPGPAPASRRHTAVEGALASLRSGPVARLLPRLSALNVVEGSVRLAAQAFITALPLLMTVAAFAPQGVQDLLTDSLRAVLGVRGDTLDEVRRAFTATGTPRDAAGAVGVLVTLVSATAFSRALQAVCERCWHLPRTPVRAAFWRWLLWLLVWLGVLLVQAPLRSGFGGGAVIGWVLSVLSATLLWWWSQHLLLGGRIGWRNLLPGALLAGTGTVVLSWAAGLFVPTAMERSLREFGPLGPVFTFLSWLIAVFLVAVSGLALGQYVASSTWYRTAAGPRRTRAEP